MNTHINGGSATVNTTTASDNRWRRAQLGTLAKLCTVLAASLRNELGIEKAERQSRRPTRILYRSDPTDADIVALVREIGADRVRKALGSPQEQLSGIVDELGIDRTLNLLNAFEITGSLR